ncbi:MAG: L-threonylcarbamoyladenylate synthase [Candidatus Krumholzibacteria bacterium]|jgi:tRNA threonylcarbamoyl adenosine modification protein (Sua5/YciO/YrdC/YwlC family)|nr:L-threonylcarbamoyladenylate synthase [Candidatus Krumholzibacteria bacterium]
MNAADKGLAAAGVLTCLDRGQAVLLPTDTVPGLHARLDRPRGLAALTALKGRAEAKPYLILVATIPDALALASPLVPPAADFLRRCWPGPFTFVVPAGATLPPQVVTPAGGIALRVPAWAALRDLLALSGPLASTSANPAGQPAPVDVAAAEAFFPDVPRWNAVPDSSAATPSALVDLTGGRPLLVRPGPLPLPDWPDRG